MLDNIKIKIDNFSSLSGEMELNGITVIKNDDFEVMSDLNRILFANLISLSVEGDYASSTLFRKRIFDSLSDIDLSLRFMMKYNKFINDWDDYNVSYKYLSKKYKGFKKILNKRMKVDFSEIEEYLQLHNNSKKYRDVVFDEMLNREFKHEGLKDYDDFKIKLIIDDEYENMVKYEDEKIITSISHDLKTLPGNIIYMDMIPIMNLFDFDSFYHYEELYSILIQTHIESKTNNHEIIEMITDINNGEFEVYDGFEFYDRNLDEVYLHDVSTQAKHLGVIQLLLHGYAIPKKSIILIDNIDIEMDDNYIDKTAEILAKLTKILNLFVLVSTDNDKFINALKNHYEDLFVYDKNMKRI